MNTSEAASKADGIIPVPRSSLWNTLTADKVKHLAAGGIAGAVSRTSVSPFERLKILYQVCSTMGYQYRDTGILLLRKIGTKSTYLCTLLVLVCPSREGINTVWLVSILHKFQSVYVLI